MNEFLFLSQLFFILVFTAAFSRLGRGALVAFVAIQGVLSNLFVLKQMVVFGMPCSCSEAFTVGQMLALNRIADGWGQKAAGEAVAVNFLCLLAFVAFSQLHVAFAAGEVDDRVRAFELLFRPAPRLFLASLAACVASQSCDIRLFCWLRRTFRAPSLAAACSISLSQVVDTLLFATLGLWGVMPHVVGLAATSLVFKLSLSLALPLFSPHGPGPLQARSGI